MLNQRVYLLPRKPLPYSPTTPSMSHQNFSHHHADGESEDEVNGLELRRVSGAQDSEFDLYDSFADDILRQLPSMYPRAEAVTPYGVGSYEHTILQSLQRDPNMSSLDKLKTICESSSSHFPDGHPLKAALLGRLGTVLKMKGLEDEAMDAFERALDAAEVDSNGLRLMRICFSNIGALLSGRYKRLGEAEDLHKAIWAQEMCIACTAADGNSRLDRYYHFLSFSLKKRWDLLKDEEDLNRLLSYAEKAVELNPSNALHQLYLSLALRATYKHHHTLALLDRAIRVMRSTVSSSMPRYRMMILSELAESYYSRFNHVQDPSDASACIKCIDQAMECGKILSFSEHGMLMDCLLNVFRWNDDVQCYERALVICETLLADTSLSNSERCLVHLVLGNTLLVPCEKGVLSPVPRQLEKCIQMLKRVIECTSPEHYRCRRYVPYKSLCRAFRLRFQIETATVEELEYAISIGRKAVELASEGDKADCLLALGMILNSYSAAVRSRKNNEQSVLVFRQASQLSSPGSGDTRLMSAICEANACAIMQDWTGCINAYTIAMEAVQHWTWLGLSVVQQHRVISQSRVKINAMGRHAAFVAVIFGDSGLALEWTEQCRSIVWQRVLNLRVSMDVLAGVEPTLARRLGEVSDLLQRGAYFDLQLGMEEGSLEIGKQQRYRLAEEWEDLVAQTHSLPGFTDFLKPKDSAYFTSCEFGGMVVLLNVYNRRCHAIVLGSNKGKLVVCPLKQMNEKLATTLQARLRATLQQSGRHSRNARASEAWSGHAEHDVMSNVLSVLWKTVVKPLFDFLDLKPHDSSSESDPPRLWWCPTGLLSFLPLHAAGLFNTAEHGTKVYEYVASSYTPTVGILADISNQRSEEFSGLLTVCQPHTPGQNQIPKTEDEVCSVVQVAVESGLAMDITSLDNDGATPEAVLSGMAGHSWIHFACHARQDPTQPLESAFMLGGDPKEGRPLKLTEISERANRNADFAFLSACQTAMGDTSLSEESVHLAAGMLIAGYRRVIATMWAVNDSDAPIIAEMVYKYMLSDGKADSGKSCLALHHATASLREKVGEKAFKRWVPFIHYGA
ncbi:CHAT domain-containing protein [Armillaria nabsnona]|nr:CHAT domain-containing protein [Armillaria nabsnona]